MAETIFGYKSETIADASAFWLRYVHPDDHDLVQLSRLSQLEQGREEIEYRLKLSDGNYRWISDSHTLVRDEDGKPMLLIDRSLDRHTGKESNGNRIGSGKRVFACQSQVRKIGYLGLADKYRGNVVVRSDR